MRRLRCRGKCRPGWPTLSWLRMRSAYSMSGGRRAKPFPSRPVSSSRRRTARARLSPVPSSIAVVPLELTRTPVSRSICLRCRFCCPNRACASFGSVGSKLWRCELSSKYQTLNGLFLTCLKVSSFLKYHLAWRKSNPATHRHLRIS